MLYVNNLHVRQSRQANDSTSIAKRAKDAWCYADRKSLFTLSNSFDNRGIWPPVVLSLTFAIAKSFFGALCNTSAIIGLS